MKITEKQQELIQKYLSGELKGDDEVLFEQYKDMPEFKIELLFQAQVLDSLVQVDEDWIREELIKNETPRSNTKSSSNSNGMKIKMVLMLGVILLLVTAFWYLTNVKSDISEGSNYRDVIAMNNVPYPLQKNSRGAVNPMEVSKAMRAYANGNYSEALALFNTITEPSEEEALYIASCHIQLEQFSDAQTILSPLVNSQKIDIKHNAEWYLIISQFGNDLPVDAMSGLQKISTNSNHLFFERSKNMLSTLNK